MNIDNGLGIVEESTKIHWVESEPGDGTRYSYGIIQDKDRDRFLVVPLSSTFKFPVQVQSWVAKKLYCETLGMSIIEKVNYADSLSLLEKDVNPYTFVEVMRGIAEVFKWEVGVKG